MDNIPSCKALMKDKDRVKARSKRRRQIKKLKLKLQATNDKCISEFEPKEKKRLESNPDRQPESNPSSSCSIISDQSAIQDLTDLNDDPLMKDFKRYLKAKAKVQKFSGTHVVKTVVGQDCKDSGLMVAGMRYDCNALLNKTISDKKHLGVYVKRNSMCKEKYYSDCCKTCKQVLKNECKDDTLTMADAGYDCKALVNKTYSDSKNLGVYERNIQFCNNTNYSGCCETCQIVLKEASSTDQDDSTDNVDQVNSDRNGGPVNNAEKDIKTPQDSPNTDSGSLYAPNQEKEPQVAVASGRRGFKYNIEVHEVEKDGRLDVIVSVNKNK